VCGGGARLGEHYLRGAARVTQPAGVVLGVGHAEGHTRSMTCESVWHMRQQRHGDGGEHTGGWKAEVGCPFQACVERGYGGGSKRGGDSEHGRDGVREGGAWQETQRRPRERRLRRA
jgi:hypothetical protein